MPKGPIGQITVESIVEFTSADFDPLTFFPETTPRIGIGTGAGWNPAP